MLKYFVKTSILIPEANKTCKVLTANDIIILFRKLGKLTGYKFGFEGSTPHREGNQIDLCRYLYVQWEKFFFDDLLFLKIF